ncbi:MAG: right-handed parallel beta-helix repeat-containing protein [Deltaproteobacteria bacterium]
MAVAPSTTGNTYYVDAAAGNDANVGTSTTTALKTIGAAVAKVAPGDTVLIRAGLYREVVMLASVSGTAGMPITFGSYGDGEVIVDGSAAVTGWTLTSGTVWQAPVTNGSAIDAVVVNGEVLARYKTTSAIPASGSGQWWFDGNSTLYADMGGSDPTSATADVIVIVQNHGGSTIFLGGSAYLDVIGLTIRGSGWAGIWSYQLSSTASGQTVGGHDVRVAYCNIELNDADGLGFGGGSNDFALYNHVYHNSLVNWPFGANGYAVAGGGWPGGLGFTDEANPVVRGNVVALNGGEGIILYGNGLPNGLQSGNSLVEENVSYDNWSTNIYIDNEPTHVIRRNLVYRHPTNPAWMWDPTDEYTMEKSRTCLGLGDEYASGNPAGTASIANVEAYDNLFIGCRYGIQDGFEDTTGHGMKHDLIVNNTVVMDSSTYTQEATAGILIADDGTNSVGTVIGNNIVYRPVACASGMLCPLADAQGAAVVSGVTLENNLYFAVGAAASDTSLFASDSATAPNLLGFSGWQSFEQTDATSVYADPQLAGGAVVQPTGNATCDYMQADVQSTSPAHGLAVPQTSVFSVDFTGATRGASWTAGALQ